MFIKSQFFNKKKLSSSKEQQKMKQYRVIVNTKDPKINLRIPLDILRDLTVRSEENGHTIENEFAIRLARSLERDNAMIQEDNDLVYKAFMISQQKTKTRSE